MHTGWAQPLLFTCTGEGGSLGTVLPWGSWAPRVTGHIPAPKGAFRLGFLTPFLLLPSSRRECKIKTEKPTEERSKEDTKEKLIKNKKNLIRTNHPVAAAGTSIWR